MIYFLLLIHVLLGQSVSTSNASDETYYIKSTDNSSCPEDSSVCLTLNESVSFLHNSSADNITIILLAGNHTLNTDLTVENVISFTMFTTDDSDIVCEHENTSFQFYSISQVEISGLVFHGCRVSCVNISNQFTLNRCEIRGGNILATTTAGVELNSVDFAFISKSSFSGINKTAEFAANGGAIQVNSSHITITDSIFDNNIALNGGSVFALESLVTIVNSEFLNNKGTGLINSLQIGGAIGAMYSRVTTNNSVFSNNSIGYFGGAIGVLHSTIEVYNNTFRENSAGFGGGGIGVLYSTLYSYYSTFMNNKVQIGFAETGGGAIFAVFNSNTIIDGGFFSGNSAPNALGGAIAKAYSVSLVVKNAMFTGNQAHVGGAILVAYMQAGPNSTDVQNCSFTNNTAETGAAVAAYSSRMTFSGVLNVQKNTADVGILFVGSCTTLVAGTFIFKNNSGSLFVYNSEITFEGETLFKNNKIQTSHGILDQGGGLTSFQSTVNFNGATYIMNNEANKGGGILSTESIIINFGNTTIEHNRAYQSGGGIYAYQSVIHTRKNMSISYNKAGYDGGGVYSVSTNTAYVNGSLDFYFNSATGKGGAMYLESDSKLYISKEVAVCFNPGNSLFHDCITKDPIDYFTLNFISNTAAHGGALFVADNTTSGTCTVIQSSVNTAECFYQVLASYNLDIIENFELSIVLENAYFANNSAQVSGDTLYGGLLDRCTVSSFAEVLVAQEGQENNFIHGFAYFNKTSNLNITEVSSAPVRVCFCNGTTPDCAYKPLPICVFKGETFEISLVAIDQVNNTIPNTTIHGFVLAATESLGEGQTVQRTNDGCTSLQYNVFSPNDNTKLYLYANGPCKDRGISTMSIDIELKSCPIGFKNRNNRCECDARLDQYISNCSINSQSVVRVNNTVWISYVNDTELRGYVTYPNCPFDYCKTATEQEVTINLNEEDGSDAQCAFNRSGTLCGRCANGTSVILGSSRCMDCNGQNAYLSLFIVFALAGVLLVTFLLALNLTVAVGTINGLIFYANIIAANRAIFIRPFSSSNILHVFIAWVNLDFGFETCLFDGMDDYIKTWLQLAFPLYIIFLVVLIIIITEKSQRMTKLLQNRNPVATLATLVLLSYAKVYRVVITAFSYATLQFPITNSSGLVNHKVWLADGNMAYLKGEHIPLFIVAIIVLVVGLLYTFLIFSWQWILRCPNNTCLKWTANTKLKCFMDAYNAQYKTQHRYWTGFLLLSRIFLYLIASTNIIYDPGFNLISIIIVVSILVLFGTLTSGGPYKNWLLNILETSFIFNLLIFSVVSYHILVNDQRDKEQKQNALANASISIVFITFTIILIYHIYEMVATKFNKIKQLGENIQDIVRTKTRRVRFFKAQNQESPMVQTLLEPKHAKTSIRLQRRLDLIGDEPIECVPVEPAPLIKTTAVTHTVIDGIPTDS